MRRVVTAYVHGIDAVNRFLGRISMYMIFVMMGLLLYSALSRTVFDAPLVWVVEMSQFLLTGYYLIGGGYSMQMDSHVRMDLFYSQWSPKRRASFDAVTIWFLIFYLVFLLIGGVSSTQYAIEYNQKNYSSWGPPLAPIKLIMTAGIGLMLLQAVAMFFRNVAEARGKPLA